MANNNGVHQGHCCKGHGCKYGDFDCPVVSGVANQFYPCEQCSYFSELESEYNELQKSESHNDSHNEYRDDYYNEIINDYLHESKWQQELKEILAKN